MFLAIGHGAGDRIDNDVFRSGIVLGGVSVSDADDVAGELDEGILESAAGGEQRPVAAAGELDALEHAIKALVRAAGRGPQGVETFKNFISVEGGERGGGQPLGFNFESQLAGGVLDGIGGGVVRTKFGIEVSQNSNANGVGHAGIVLEGIEVNGRIS